MATLKYAWSYSSGSRILFYVKGHAVSALALSRICLVGAYLNCVEGTMHSVPGDVFALYNRAVDFLITCVAHISLPPNLISINILSDFQKNIRAFACKNP